MRKIANLAEQALRGLEEQAKNYARMCEEGWRSKGVQNIVELRRKLRLPLESLAYAFRSFAFSRAGAEQAGYGKMAERALTEVGKLDGRAVWEKFQELCREEGKRPNEQLNKAVIEGLIRLQLGWGGEKGFLAKMGEGMRRTGKVEKFFLMLVAVHGIGEKIASFALRDVAWIFEAERKIRRDELMFLQPVDTWVKKLSGVIWEDLKNPRIPSWAIAKRICDECLKLGISPIKVNQGMWWFGSHKLRRKPLPSLRELVHRLGREGLSL